MSDDVFVTHRNAAESGTPGPAFAKDSDNKLFGPLTMGSPVTSTSDTRTPTAKGKGKGKASTSRRFSPYQPKVGRIPLVKSLRLFSEFQDPTSTSLTKTQLEQLKWECPMCNGIYVVFAKEAHEPLCFTSFDGESDVIDLTSQDMD